MFKNSKYNFIFSLVIVTVTALICSYFNRFAMLNFYSYIKLPTLTPPNYVFPLVWTIIYSMMIIAYDIILNQPYTIKTQNASLIFVANLLLQILWCFIFFYNALFLLGFSIIVILNAVTLFTLRQFYNINKISGYLLIPLQIWLLFAGWLNWQICALNGASYIF